MKRKKRSFFIHLLSLSLACSIVCPFSVKATAENPAETAEVSEETADSGWPAEPSIQSPSGFLLEDTTGTILYEKGGSDVRYPGSSVKIMTMLLALENSALTDNVTFTQTGVAAAANGAANIAVKDGEVLTMEQCLYAISLSSANDVCVQIAEQISGSVEAFVEKMNARATELGCTNTVFTNPTGLPDENQHSTAHDLALILKAAIDNPDFCTISSAAEYTIPATNMTGTARALKNTFPLSAAGSTTLYEGILAGKSGYTQASGSTLVAAAERNGTRLICVVLMGADGQTALDAMDLLDYGFGAFQRVQYSDPDSTVSGGYAMLPNGVTLNQIEISEQPVEQGLSQEYYYQNRLVGHGIVTPEEEVEEEPDPEAIDNEEYLKTLSQEKSLTPYYIIAGVGAALLALLLFLLIRVLKS